MIKVGKEILAADPENLNVIYALAFNIRRNELLAAPPVYTNADGRRRARQAVASRWSRRARR